jgi:hypothetical protein
VRRGAPDFDGLEAVGYCDCTACCYAAGYEGAGGVVVSTTDTVMKLCIECLPEGCRHSHTLCDSSAQAIRKDMGAIRLSL